MDGCQVSVVDLDQLVQVLGLLDLVLELQTCTVQDLQKKTKSSNLNFKKRNRTRGFNLITALSCSP